MQNAARSLEGAPKGWTCYRKVKEEKLSPGERRANPEKFVKVRGKGRS